MMKRALILAGLLALAACSQAPVPPAGNADLSAQKLSTADDDRAVELAVHTGSGAVYALTDSYSDDSTGEGSSAAFLRRYSRSGAVVWQRQLGGGQNSDARALATDAGGNLYVSYNDRLEKRRSDGGVVWSRAVADVTALGTDGNGHVYVGSGSYDAFTLSKYTGGGSRQWSMSVEGYGIGFIPSSIGTDAAGNVYVAAYEIDDSFINSYVVKFSPSGAQLWQKTVSGGDNDLRLTGLEVRGNAIYLSGTSHTNWIGDYDRPTEADAFVAKLSLGGVELWRKVFGTASPDSANDLSTDAGGNLYVTGFTAGKLGGAQPGGSDVFLRKLSTNGGTLWTKQIGSAGDDAGNAVVAYSSTELYLAGEAGGALIGGTHRGGQDAFLRRTDGNGNRVWTDQ